MLLGDGVIPFEFFCAQVSRIHVAEVFHPFIEFVLVEIELAKFTLNLILINDSFEFIFAFLVFSVHLIALFLSQWLRFAAEIAILWV